MYHILCVSYGWTIDYINENITLPQIGYLIEQIKEYPPTSIVSFGMGEKNRESKLLKQLDKFGDKVKTKSWIDKPSIKSVVRLRDKVKLK